MWLYYHNICTIYDLTPILTKNQLFQEPHLQPINTPSFWTVFPVPQKKGFDVQDLCECLIQNFKMLRS